MGPTTDEKVQAAVSIVQQAQLPYPLDRLLESFVFEALNPRLAASFLQRHCHDGPTLHSDALSLVSDWKYIVESVLQSETLPQAPDVKDASMISSRDGMKCCITGKPGTRNDPLIVTPVLPLPVGWIQSSSRVFDMLGAFFTPLYRDWWLKCARDPKSIRPLNSHWLVCQSAAAAFARGEVRMDRLQPSMIEYQISPVFIGLRNGPLFVNGSVPVLGDHSRRGTSPVDARFIGTHARFSTSIRWIIIEKRILSRKQGTHGSVSDAKRLSPSLPKRQGTLLAVRGWLQSVILAVWRLYPNNVRVFVYECLRKVGSVLYDYEGNNVQRLPLGLFLKYPGDPGLCRNEFNTLQMIHKHTCIPAPRPLDIAVASSAYLFRQKEHLLMTRMPGRSATEWYEELSDDEMTTFVQEMQGIVSQIRNVPKLVGDGYTICDSLGGPIRDHRIRDATPFGPFENEDGFNALLRNPDDMSRKGHKTVFAHADLNFRNILIDEASNEDGTIGWRVTGIVDWETAGFYPEYWEYTKMLFESFRYEERLKNQIHRIFGAFGDFSKEVEVEKRSWEEGDYI